MKIKYIPSIIEAHLESCPICLFKKDPIQCPVLIELLNEYHYLIEYEEN
jgi:hypothetical protein